MTPLEFALGHLLRGSLVIALGYAALRLWRIESPTLRQAAVLAVLLAAIWPWKLPVQLAWLAPPETAASVAAPQAAPRATGVERPTDWLQAELPDAAPAATNSSNTNSTARAVIRFFHASRGIWLARLATIWLTGVAALLLLGASRYLQLVREARHTLPAEPAWSAEWLQLLRQRGVRSPVPLLVTRALGPMLGLLPRGFCLLLPGDYWRELAPVERRTVLRHELAHYLRGDVLTACLVRLLALPFWFHPLASRLVALFDEAAEWACDRAAAADDDVAYARALGRLMEHNLPAIPLALGRCAQSHPLVTRVRRILNPVPEDSLMKIALFGATVALVVCVSLVQVRLVAQEQRAATLESVQEEMKQIQSRLTDIKAAAERAKEDAQALKGRVEEHLERLKALGKDPSQLSADGQKRIELVKTGDEAKQVTALEGADKLKDEGLILCAYVAKEGATEAVRRKALALACSLGEEGLPVLAFSLEGLSSQDRVFVIQELVKHKDKIDPVVFARLCRDSDEQVRIAALTAGLETKNPLVFLSLAGDGNEEITKAVLARTSFLKGDDLQSLLFALALKAPEDYLPETVRKAAELKERGYPIIGAVFKRKTPESRAEIVKLFRKSSVPLAKRVVEEALRDDDASLRTAAEKANQD